MSIGLDEEKSIVLAAELAATGGGAIGDTLSKEPTFRFLLQTLHDEEVVSEEALLSWATDKRVGDANSPAGRLFFQKPTQDFLQWLEEESEEESSEEDSDNE
jgi:translation initiation factor eIF-2B subunit epsilon